MTNSLKRFSAPISDSVWDEIDDNAADILRSRLSARTVVDFNGPLGWDVDSIGLGRTNIVDNGGADKPSWGTRQSLPLVELRQPFILSLSELENLERGAKDVDLDALEAAAKAMAAFEENIVYKGLAQAGIEGMLSGADTEAIVTEAQPAAMVDAVAAAITQLRENNIGGPYALVGGSKAFDILSRIIQGGGTVYRIVEQMTGSTPEWSPVIDGAAVVSLRGGDYELTVGQDLSVGYTGHDSDNISLYLVETLTFRVLEPRATVEIKFK
ncbi:MAG: family 1 encapsulin nanocompartment shell protein [Candidatus Hydrogenedentales bacterium]|jgi:uncharacterized linocin/CFP29 family protein